MNILLSLWQKLLSIYVFLRHIQLSTFVFDIHQEGGWKIKMIVLKEKKKLSRIFVFFYILLLSHTYETTQYPPPPPPSSILVFFVCQKNCISSHYFYYHQLFSALIFHFCWLSAAQFPVFCFTFYFFIRQSWFICCEIKHLLVLKRVKMKILRFAGLYTRHVLPTVLAGPSPLLREASGPWKTCSGCRIYPTYLGSRHLLCQWENSLLSLGHHRKPILTNFAYWWNFKEY